MENGVLVGRGPGTHHLYSERGDFANFHLKAKVRINNRGNSGVFFRSGFGEARPGVVSPAGYEADVCVGRPENVKTGSLVHNGKPGVHLQKSPVGADEWFTLEILAEGTRSQILVNGVRTVDYTDPAYAAGHFALQVWDDPKTADTKVEFASIEIKELPGPVAPPPAAKFVPLFNGKDLTGWKTDPKYGGDWLVANGVLIGRGPGKHHLYTERGDFTDFHLRAKVRINAGGNSGVYFRCGFGERMPNYPGPAGYEAQIWLGDKPDDPKTGSLRGGKGQNELKSLVKPGEWFTLEVITQGNRSRVRINDKDTADVVDPTYTRGHIALQVWDGPSPDVTKVEYDSIEIKEAVAPAAVAPAPPVVVPKDDPFAAGTFWRGVKIIEKGESVGTYFYELEIKERAGNAFTGSAVEVGIDNPTAVTGTIDGTLLTWKETPLRPNSTHVETTVKGNRTGGALTVSTTATFRGGKTNAGRATLMRVVAPGEDAGTDFRPLFDGRTLAGWESHSTQKQGFAVKDGRLVGRGTGLSHLYSTKEYGDVHVKCRVRLNAGGNSGLYLRSSFGPAAGRGFPAGYEVQIFHGVSPQTVGSLYVFSLSNPVPSKLPADAVKPNEWFDLECIVQAKKVRTLVNGKEAVAVTDPVARPRGRIALQMHDDKTEVEFAMIAVKELKP